MKIICGMLDLRLIINLISISSTQFPVEEGIWAKFMYFQIYFIRNFRTMRQRVLGIIMDNMITDIMCHSMAEIVFYFRV
jgi:uncharacterized membrane protein